jgi:hypothetical protein
MLRGIGGDPIAAKDNQNLYSRQGRHAAFSTRNTTEPVVNTIASAMSPRARAALVFQRNRRIAPKQRSCRISATAAHTVMIEAVSFVSRRWAALMPAGSGFVSP